MAWISFGALPCRKKKNLMTARVSMLLKLRASMTCFRACFLPGRAKDLSAPRYSCTIDGTWVKYNEMCGAFLANTGIAIQEYSTKSPSHFQFVHHMSVVDMYWDVLRNVRKVPILGASFHKNLWGNGCRAPHIAGLGSKRTVVGSDSRCRKVFPYKMSAPWYTHNSYSVSSGVEVRKAENLSVRRWVDCNEMAFRLSSVELI